MRKLRLTGLTKPYQEALDIEKVSLPSKSHLKKYRLTPMDYAKLLVTQHFRCAICKVHILDCKRRFAIDHCHTTKNVRGLLCVRCNIALGLFRDNPRLLAHALVYLEKYQVRSNFQDEVIN